MYLIKGHWQLAGGHGSVQRDEALADMARWVDAGITVFDCADIYTGVEDLIGAFRRRVGDGVVTVNTKCVPDLDRLHALSTQEIAALIDRSRARLQMDTLDLVQLHWWDYALGNFAEAARALHVLQQRGLLREIGVTNFGVPQLERIAAADVPLRSHQVQYSLLDRRPAREMADWCLAHNVSLLCYGTLAGGFIGERWLGAAEPMEPLENRSLTKYKLIIDEAGGWERFQVLLRALSDVARSHGVGIGTVAIRWVLDQPGVSAAIVGARSAQHLADTRRALTLAFTDHDRAQLASALAELRVPPGDVYELERDRDGTHGRIMRYHLNSSR